MTINKRIKRNVLKNKFFYISSILLCMLTVFFIIAAVSTGQVIRNAVAHVYKTSNIEEAEFAVMGEIENTKELEKRFSLTLEKMEYIDIEKDSTTLRVYKESSKINTHKVKEGNNLARKDEILINEDFALPHNYKIGDVFSYEDSNFSVVGYATKPDYTYMLNNLSDSYINKKMFGIAVVNGDGFETLKNQSLIVKDYYSVIYDHDNSKEFRRYLNDNYRLGSYLAATSNQRINYPLAEGEAITDMAMNFAPFLFLLTMGVITVVLSRMVKKERKLIGTLFA